jgi:hypothetical protein
MQEHIHPRAKNRTNLIPIPQSCLTALLMLPVRLLSISLISLFEYLRQSGRQ